MSCNTSDISEICDSRSTRPLSRELWRSRELPISTILVSPQEQEAILSPGTIYEVTGYARRIHLTQIVNKSDRVQRYVRWVMKLVNGVTYTFWKRSLNFEPPVTPFNQLTWRLRHLVWNNSFMYQNVRTLFCCVCYHSLVYLCCVWANPCVKAQEEITRLTNATQTADPDPNFLVCNWYSSLIKLAIILKIRPRQCLYSHAVHATSLTYMLFCLILKWIF